MFSTHLGRYAPRVGSDAAIILRSSPEDDQESMILKLRQRFPKECKDMNSLQPNIFTYFDHYDAHLHGSAFLYSVLTTIAMQNNTRMEYVRKFATDWGRNNPELFNNLMSQTQDVFTEPDRQEYGCEFLADVFVELQLRKNTVSQTHQTSAIPPKSNENCHFDSNPYHSISNMHTAQSDYNGPFLSPQPNDIRAQIPTSFLECQLSPPSSNDLLPSQIKVLDQSQSSARHGFNSGLGAYTNEGFRPELIDAITAVTSQSPSGSPSYHQVQPDHQNEPPIFQNTVPTPVIQNPRKTSTDDVRVLEIQEAAFQDQVPLENMEGHTTFQYSAESSSQIQPLKSEILQSTGQIHVDLGQENPGLYPQHTDPAVVYAIGLSNKTQEVPPVVHMAQFRPLGVELAAANDHQIPRYSIHAKLLDTKTHTATEAHRPYRPSQNAEGPAQAPLSSGQLVEQNCVGLSLQNHERSVYWEPKGEWSPQYPPSTLWNAGNMPLPIHQRERTSSNLKVPDKNKVWVGGLPDDTSESTIRQLFEKYGQVTSVRVVRRSDQGRGYNREFAFVTFESAIDAAKAIDNTQESRLGNDKVQVRSAFERTPRSTRYQYQTRDSWSMNRGPQQNHHMGQKEEMPAIWTMGKAGKPIFASEYVSRDTSERERYGNNSPTLFQNKNPRDREDLTICARQNEQTSQRKDSLSSSKSIYSRQSSFTQKQDRNIATDPAPFQKKSKNPSKFRRIAKVNIPTFNEKINMEEPRKSSPVTLKVDLSSEQESEQKSERSDLKASESSNKPMRKSPHRQFPTEPGSTPTSSGNSTSQDHCEPSQYVPWQIENKGEPLNADNEQPTATNFSTMVTPAHENRSSSMNLSDSTPGPQPKRLSSYMGGSEVSLEPSPIRDISVTNETTSREQKDLDTSNSGFGSSRDISVMNEKPSSKQKDLDTSNSGFESSELTVKALEEHANVSENCLSVERITSQNSSFTSGLRELSSDEISSTGLVITSILPNTSTINDPASLVSQPELKAAKSFANLAGNSTELIIARASTEHSCSDQIKPALHQQTSKISPKSSTSTSTPAAIVTHKKKKKIFPSNNDSDDSCDVASTLKNEDLPPKNLMDQAGEILGTSNMVESPLVMENVETMSTPSKQIYRDPTAYQEPNDKLIKEDVQIYAASKLSSPPNTMGKNTRKAKNKAKSQSKKAMSKSSGADSPVHNNNPKSLPTLQPPYLVSDDNGQPPIESDAITRSSTKTLPKPETPYLVSDEFVFPYIDSHDKAGSTAVNSDTQHQTNVYHLVSPINPHTGTFSRKISLPEPETPYLVNDKHIVPAINYKTDSDRAEQSVNTIKDIRLLLEHRNRFRKKSNSPKHNSPKKRDIPNAQQITMPDLGPVIGGYQQPTPSPRICEAPLLLEFSSNRDLDSDDLDFEVNKSCPQSDPPQVSEKTTFSQKQAVIKASPSTPTSKMSQWESLPEPNSLIQTLQTRTASLPPLETEPMSSGLSHIDAVLFHSTNVNIMEQIGFQEVERCESPQAQTPTSLPHSPTHDPRFPSSEANLSPEKTTQKSESGGGVDLGTTDSKILRSTAEDATTEEHRSGRKNSGSVFGRAGVPTRANDPWILPRGEPVWGKSGMKRSLE